MSDYCPQDKELVEYAIDLLENDIAFNFAGTKKRKRALIKILENVDSDAGMFIALSELMLGPDGQDEDSCVAVLLKQLAKQPDVSA